MLTITVATITFILSAATILSFLRVPHGFVRIFSFPRLQILVLAAVTLAVSLLFVPEGAADTIIVVALVAVIVAQSLLIAQFTPLRHKQSATHDGDPDGPNTVSILAYNVKLSNTRFADAIALVTDNDPDIALFVETDERWISELSALKERYPYVVAHPLDNGYGMVVYSRFALEDVEVQFLVMDEVPSIVATVVLPDGQRFKLYCVHPEPPVPHIDSVGRDAELLKVAARVEKDPMPAIVTGDLNDVAWSNTTRRFQRLSRLLDPRVGRGFYNTFDTRYAFLRWPLDHLFHDRRFHFVAMKRLPNAGSDHFPMYFKLALEGDDPDIAMPDKADASDREEAAEIKQEAKELDREAIGVDWEKG